MGAFGAWECPICREIYQDTDDHKCSAEDLAARVAELEGEKEKLRAAVLRAANAFRYYGKEVFGASNFTDRHSDSDKCLRLTEMMIAALDKEARP